MKQQQLLMRDYFLLPPLLNPLQKSWLEPTGAQELLLFHVSICTVPYPPCPWNSIFITASIVLTEGMELFHLATSSSS